MNLEPQCSRERSGRRAAEIVSLTWNQIIGLHDGDEVSMAKLLDVPIGGEGGLWAAAAQKPPKSEGI